MLWWTSATIPNAGVIEGLSLVEARAPLRRGPTEIDFGHFDVARASRPLWRGHRAHPPELAHWRGPKGPTCRSPGYPAWVGRRRWFGISALKGRTTGCDRSPLGESRRRDGLVQFISCTGARPPFRKNEEYRRFCTATRSKTMEVTSGTGGQALGSPLQGFAFQGFRSPWALPRAVLVRPFEPFECPNSVAGLPRGSGRRECLHRRPLRRRPNSAGPPCGVGP